MTPVLRGKVKPTIEIMAALPTVILGFLAGLWLAPFVENYLSAIFAILLLLPFMMLIAAWCWRYAPASWRNPSGPWLGSIVVNSGHRWFHLLMCELKPCGRQHVLQRQSTSNGLPITVLPMNQRNALSSWYCDGFCGNSEYLLDCRRRCV